MLDDSEKGNDPEMKTLRSLKKRILLGFYLSLMGSLLIIAFISFWEISYSSRIYTMKESWNTYLNPYFYEKNPDETVKTDFSDLLNRTKKMPFVDLADVKAVEGSLSLFRTSSPDLRGAEIVSENIQKLFNNAHKKSILMVILATVLIAGANIAVLTFFVFRPQKKFVDFVNSVSEDLMTLNVDRTLEPRKSSFVESTNLTEAFNTLSGRAEIYRMMLTITQRAKTVDELTKELYLNLRKVVKFNRIAFVGIKDGILRPEASFTDSKKKYIGSDFTQSYSEGTLKEVIKSKKPRIIGDLEEYSRENPDSETTGLLVKEGMKSSLTFPIYVGERSIGLLFFDSFEKGAFTSKEVRKLDMISEFLSLAYQKTSLTHELVISATTGFTKLVEGKDNETGKHLVRMATYSEIIARELSKDPKYPEITGQYVKDIREQSPLHDIGKVGIPDRILMKPGKLSLSEFEIMKTHTVIGYDILKDVDAQSESYEKKFFEMGRLIARHHHERWDGRGYPDGLREKEIPLCARIVAIADVFDALTTKRPYKDAFGYEKSMKMITEASGKQFDPDVVGAFLNSQDRIREVQSKMVDDEDPV